MNGDTGRPCDRHARPVGGGRQRLDRNGLVVRVQGLGVGRAISSRPTASVTATAENPSPSPVEQILLNIPAAPVISSGTFRATGAAAVLSGITAKLLSVIQSVATSAVPADNNAQGYAVVENLAALPGGILTADAVEAEALARCTGNSVTFSTAGRVTDIKVAGVTLPEVITAKPNQVLLDNALRASRSSCGRPTGTPRRAARPTGATRSS